MNFETMNIWCWLIPVIIGVICGILGYLIGKGATEAEDTSTEVKSLHTRNNKLQADLDACHKKLADTGKIGKSTTTSSTTTASFASGVSTGSISFDAATAKAVFGKNIKQDDLKVIEGIGPKIEGMFKDSGIKNWKALSDASVADCQKVLGKGGKRYRIHDPASWPMQAKMCYEGKWNDLMKWQEEHKHGKL